MPVCGSGRSHVRNSFSQFAVRAAASAVFAVGLPLCVSAQTPPKATWIRFTVDTVKPEMVREYESYNKQLAAAYKTAGQPLYVVFTNFSGNRYEYTTVTEVMKFGDMDGANPIAKAVGEDAYNNMVRGIARCVATSTRYFSLPWDDISINKTGPSSVYFMRTRIPVATGKNADYQAYMKNELKPVLEKGGVTWYRASMPVFGGPVATVETMRMMKNLGEIDAGPITRQVLGVEGAAALSKKTEGLTRGASQNTLMVLLPELSLLPSGMGTK